VLRELSPFLDTPREEARDVRSLGRPATEMMRTDPVTVAPETPVPQAVTRLLKHSVSALPVIDGDTLVGIVTTRDLLRYYAESDADADIDANAA
jgi:acetoin utilization protein AcuB